jgi:hypothetical protein
MKKRIYIVGGALVVATVGGSSLRCNTFSVGITLGTAPQGSRFAPTLG